MRFLTPRPGLAIVALASVVALIADRASAMGVRMRPVVYEVTEWGPQVGEGLSDAVFCTLGGVAKRNSPSTRYAVANELICSRLGLMLGLPVPPGVIAQSRDDDEPVFVSLRFGRNRTGTTEERLPPVNPSQLVGQYPFEAAGIIAFDSWIANHDRHKKNLAFRKPSRPLVVFDHDLALLGPRPEGQDIARLNANSGTVTRVLEGHCLAPHVSSSLDLKSWCDRIARFEPAAIRSICEEVRASNGFSEEEAIATYDFLVNRKKEVLGLCRASYEYLPKLQQWDLGL